MPCWRSLGPAIDRPSPCWRARNGPLGDRLVLAYHAISDTWPAALSIEPERLEAQIETLAELGYESMTFTEAVTSRRARNTVAVTFDDGLRSVVEHGLPILSRYGFVGTAFVPTDHIGRDEPVDWPNLDRWIGGPHEPELRPMSWAELGLLLRAGWEIGSHTRTHPRLPSLDDASLLAELVESRRSCEHRLGITCASIAYPYGDVDSRVTEAAGWCGYRAGAALPERIHRTNRLRWPRVGIWRTDPHHLFFTKLSTLDRRRLDFRSGEMHVLPQWRCGSL